MTKKTIEKAIQEAVEHVPELPRPLMQPLRAPIDFPVESMGDLLGKAAMAIQDKTKAPLAICAQSVLASATVAVQGLRDVDLPTGQKRPISNFFLTIAGSGERKSTCDDLALEPIRAHQDKLRERYQLEMREWDITNEAWEKMRRHVLSDKRKTQEATEAALKSLGLKPEKPRSPLMTSPDPTYEGLYKLVAEGMPSAGIFADEGGQFIGGHGMREENKLATAAGLSNFWDGKSTSRVRAGDGASILCGKRLSMHLMAQYMVATAFLGDGLLKDQGLHSRILVAYPESTIGTRYWDEPKPESHDILKAYTDHLLAILNRPLPLRDGQRNELEPPGLRFSAAARKLFIEYVDQIEGQLAPDETLTSITGLANKIPEHASRLAAVIALTDDPDITELSGEAMSRGIDLAQYYLTEALRLVTTGQADPTLLEAQKLLNWLLKWPESLISLPDIYQRGPGTVRKNKNTAERFIKILEDHGWLIHLPEGGIVAGKHRNTVWRIIGQCGV